MKQDTKDMILFNLDMLKAILQEEGVIIGAMVDKKEPQKAKLIFLDREKYLQGINDGFKVGFDTLNGTIEKE